MVQHLFWKCWGRGSINLAKDWSNVKSGPRMRRIEQHKLWKRNFQHEVWRCKPRNCQREVRRRIVSAKCREATSDCDKVLHTIERNYLTSVLVQSDFIDNAEWCRAWSFAQPTVITDLDNVELAALQKLMVRVMEVRTSWGSSSRSLSTINVIARVLEGSVT